MIHRARFQNFKALKDVEVTFDSRLTVLVGPNGSGKSSVLKGIYWLCQMAGDDTIQDGLSNVIGSVQTTYSGSRELQILELTAKSGADEVGVRFRAHPTLIVTGATATANAQNWECVAIHKGKPDRQRTAHNRTPGGKLFPFLPAEWVCLDSPRMAQPSMTTTTPPRVNPDGGGLASLMAYFKLYDEPRYAQVVDLFRRIIPQVRGIRINRVQAGGGGALGEGLVFDLAGQLGIAATSMSDGTLYALGLIVKILDPQRPKTLLIDDIDHGFHPKAQLTLVELLHKLLDEIPDLQIIAAAHSPYILSGLNWEEVRVTGLRDDGAAVVQPLTKHPNYEKWKESMSPGEFWSHAGEEWVVRVSEPEAVAR